jgi:MoxR-like ATPase
VTPRGPLTVDVDGLTAALEERAYLADRPLALALSLSLALHRPLLLEGEAGVGKTEAAKALADVLGAELIDALYDERFLLERPLLRAIRAGGRAVLLIDEIDRADEEFEAFLLEVLSDFQVSIPELGTIRAERPPVVVLTSNRSRELSDALKRRCLYHWIELPDREREMRILRARVPDVPDAVVALVAELVARLRGLGLYKPPGPAEAIDWARAAAAIAPAMVDGAGAREREVALAVLAESLGVVVKDHEDLELVSNELGPLLGG